MERGGVAREWGQWARCLDDVLSQEGAWGLWAKKSGDCRAAATPSPLGPILGSHSITGIDFGKKFVFLAGLVFRQTQCCPWC